MKECPIRSGMGGSGRVQKRSCPLCMSDEREDLEQRLSQGEFSCKELDKEMGWRINTSDRHFRNHMGEYHLAANDSCEICTSPLRAEYEERYFSDGTQSDIIAEELEIGESKVYQHMKHHFQPLVQKTAALEVALIAGNEVSILRNNVEKLNSKLSELLEEGSIYEDGFVKDAVTLHKEVRESIKDLVKFQDKWGPQTDTQQVNQTINILSVEMAKESPEVWKKLKTKLQENMGV